MGALVLAMSAPCLVLTIGRINDAKFVAIRVGQHHVIGVGRVCPRQAGGPEGLQPGDFRSLVFGIQVEM